MKNQPMVNGSVVSLRSAFVMCVFSGLVAAGLAIAYFSTSAPNMNTLNSAIAAQVAQTPSVADGVPKAVVPKVAPAAERPSAPREFSDQENINISVYETVNRSVVNINTTSHVRDPFFMFEETAEGSGSGSVIDKKGHVLTNHHVIAGAEVISATLADGKMYEAKLIGSDPQNDIAVLKIDAPEDTLVPVQWGDSSDLKVGQQIFAIGNPFGLERTLTTGIISSLNRTLPARKKGTFTKGIIQIDAALNQGNSGGPLLDRDSRLIGMNTAIANPSKTGENTGVGFSIPVNTIRHVVPELITHGRVIRADLGIAMTFATEKGLGVAMVNPDGPADRAGMRGVRIVVEKRRQGPYIVESRRRDFEYADTIIAIDDQPVRTLDDLQTYLDSKKPGDRVSLQIIRENRRAKIELTLGEE